MTDVLNWITSDEHLLAVPFYAVMSVMLGWRTVNVALRVTHHNDQARKSVRAFVRATAYFRLS